MLGAQDQHPTTAHDRPMSAWAWGLEHIGGMVGVGATLLLGAKATTAIASAGATAWNATGGAAIRAGAAALEQTGAYIARQHQNVRNTIQVARDFVKGVIPSAATIATAVRGLGIVSAATDATETLTGASTHNNARTGDGLSGVAGGLATAGLVVGGVALAVALAPEVAVVGVVAAVGTVTLATGAYFVGSMAGHEAHDTNFLGAGRAMDHLAGAINSSVVGQAWQHSGVGHVVAQATNTWDGFWHQAAVVTGLAVADAHPGVHPGAPNQVALAARQQPHPTQLAVAAPSVSNIRHLGQVTQRA